MLSETKRLLSKQTNSGWFDKSGKAAKDILSRIEGIEVLGSGIKITPGKSAPDVWRPLAEEFRDLLRETNLPVCFLLDEFPWYLGFVAKKYTAAEVESALNWFRGMRQELAGGQTRFLVTGSIGLDGLLRRLGLSPTANDFDTLEIPPLTHEEAVDFLRDLSSGEKVPLTEAGIRKIMKLLGANWPILLELFISEIQDADLTTAPDDAQLERIYRDQMVRGARNKYCQEMFNRLAKEEMFSPMERRLAQEILKQMVSQDRTGMDDFEAIHAGVVPDPAVRAITGSELAFVLDTLRHDGYILRMDDGFYCFASNILKDYWQHRTV